MDGPESSSILITRDVSKYLKYVSGDGPPQWSQLTDREILNAYTKKLDEKIGPSGVLSKLDGHSEILSDIHP